MDAIDLFAKACREFDSRVAAVQPDQWSHFTPCSEWDVRALVNHVTVENLWVPSLLEGKTMDDVGDRFDGDQLGDDPQATSREAVERATEATSALESIDATVHVSFGDIPAHEYLMQVGADNLIHAWDLAIAVGGDTRLDGELVDTVTEWFEGGTEETYRSIGAISERPPIADDADPQARLLAMFGRMA
jgi:uncharacterized protein (TIGR03086 family)